MGKLRKEATGKMEPGRGREMGRKVPKKSRANVENRWRERLGDRETKLGERERGRGSERWGENEGERGRERSERRDSRRQREPGEAAERWERRTWAPELPPKVRASRIFTWSQPARSPALSVLRRVIKQEEEGRTRRNWDGWLSHSSSHPPETPPTRLPRMQQEGEPLSSSALGTPSRESGILSWVCL